MVGMKVNKKAAEKDEKDLERPSREEPPRRGQTCAYDLAFDYDRKYGGCGQTPLSWRDQGGQKGIGARHSRQAQGGREALKEVMNMVAG